MEIQIKGTGWGMIVRGQRDCQKLIMKGRDSAEVRALIPAELWTQAEKEMGIKEARQKAEDQLCLQVGLVKEGSCWRVPAGFIAVHPKGIAEEHSPGLFRRPSGIGTEIGRDRKLRVFAKMEDTDGFGQECQIIGITPEPKNPEKTRQHWTDGKSWEEIQEILQADEAGE